MNRKNENLVTRNKKIVQSYIGGKLTMQLIAKEHGVSRQRIEQILRESGIEKRKRDPQVEYEYVCGTCGDKFSSLQKNRKYCSLSCSNLGRRKYKTKEERKEYKEKVRLQYAKKSKDYYHNVFKKRSDWKDIVKERNDRAIKTS